MPAAPDRAASRAPDALLPQIPQRGAQILIILAIEHDLGMQPMLGQQVGGKENLSLRRMVGQSAHQARQAVGDGCVLAGLGAPHRARRQSALLAGKRPRPSPRDSRARLRNPASVRAPDRSFARRSCPPAAPAKARGKPPPPRAASAPGDRCPRRRAPCCSASRHHSSLISPSCGSLTCSGICAISKWKA